ncbi:GNAT family N-acetyltransferase [Reichenbachiella versicolor]|uniref:GNAT family N-acetyltransferase n=1 Tax=Reichenbachiella versicolor TaxID=1821036 RepID=UPI000D6E9E32|nr:GNAT family N-acetyltransferase [Reichenbachiella versicolor]
MPQDLYFYPITEDDIDSILVLISELNPSIPKDTLEARNKEMFEFDNYVCFGCFINEKLVGVTSGWLTVRLYSGKQLEVDNVIITSKYQSQGIGEALFNYLEEWALEHDCNSIELNTFSTNSRSHKFYFNQGYEILAYHFCKKLR